MKRILQTITGVALAATVAAHAWAEGDRNGRNIDYDVTITNVSKLSFTPLLVAVHNGDIRFTQAGAAPDAAIAALAEGGDIGPLSDILAAAPDSVGDMGETAGLLMPGQSVTVELSTTKRYGHVSVAAMLLPTNDTFVWLDSVAVPSKHNSTVRYMAPAYDAGSEPNDELCSNIPGPLCGGAGGSPDAGGEGYVHVSSGIHGIGDLTPADYDWRNPVAIIKIERMR